MFNALSAVKFVVSGVVGIGAGKIVKNVITNNVTVDTLLEKVTTVAGAWAIGAMAAQASKDFTDKTIDETYAALSEVLGKIKVNEKLRRINKKVSTFEAEGLDKKDFVADVETGKWSPKEPIKPSSDETFKKFNKLADAAGLPVTIKKIDGEWSLVDKTNAS